jgi:aminoglycoside phosphotransferase (APT) family kinase protein
MIDPAWDEAVGVVRDLTGDTAASMLAPLKQGKSDVFLVGRGADRPPVVAKRAREATVDNERRILELLRLAPVRSLRLYGVACASRPGTKWLVTEYAAGDPFDRQSARHLQLAGEWLAHLHLWSEGVGPLSLPDRGPSYHRAVVQEALATLDAAERALSGGAVDLEPLRGLRAVAQNLLERWDEIEQTLSAAPPVLVHSGFADKNVVIWDQAEEPAVLAFDWEQGGWGSGAADLSMVDVDAYLGVRGRLADAATTTIRRLALIGRVLWCLAPVPGERPNLLGPWPERALRKLPAYLSWSGEALDELSAQVGRATR